VALVHVWGLYDARKYSVSVAFATAILRYYKSSNICKTILLILEASKAKAEKLVVTRTPLRLQDACRKLLNTSLILENSLPATVIPTTLKAF
jgi:hypothetical protein